MQSNLVSEPDEFTGWRGLVGEMGCFPGSVPIFLRFRFLVSVGFFSPAGGCGCDCGRGPGAVLAGSRLGAGSVLAGFRWIFGHLESRWNSGGQGVWRFLDGWLGLGFWLRAVRILG